MVRVKENTLVDKAIEGEEVSQIEEEVQRVWESWKLHESERNETVRGKCFRTVT